MLTLGIETSCDETSVAVTEDGNCVLSNTIFSSEKLHEKFGGVVPEIASRSHVEKITFVLDDALKDAGVCLDEVDLIAVTKGPGLIGSLLTGVTSAKWMAFILNKQVIGINHIQAHLFSCLLDMDIDNNMFPALGLVVSGGHTSLVYINGCLDFKLIASTLDDAAGEAFDKTAKLLNLGYPGGPVIEKCAKQGNSQKIRFPIGLKDKLNFSFSGLKTSVLYYVRKQMSEDRRQKSEVRKQRTENRRQKTENPEKKSEISNGAGRRQKMIVDICASFQKTVIDTLVSKTRMALNGHSDINFLFTGGGVIANAKLREALNSLSEEFGIKVLLPQKKYCTDNAAMVANLGYLRYSKLKKCGKINNMYFEAVPDLGFSS